MKTFLFDCDGVVLDSNKIKTDAFRLAAAPFGADMAELLVQHHKKNGGVSRYLKFRYFLSEIVGVDCPEPTLDALLESYAAAVRTGLRQCAITPGLSQLRAAYPDSKWLIVSGGDQVELCEVFQERGLDIYFDGGVFGSPDTKEQILKREIARGLSPEDAIFIGDSKYDHQAAQAFGIDFFFASAWTEFSGWEEYVRTREIQVIARPIDLLGKLHKYDPKLG